MDIDQEDTITLEPCAQHLQLTILHLQQKAVEEGVSMRAEWRIDGGVLLHYDDFSQRMRCQNGQMVVDFPGFVPLPRDLEKRP